MTLEGAIEIVRADVYFNLHSKLWSVKCRKSGHVKAHAGVVSFPWPVSFVVSEAGRERVLREQRKNVHAYVRGSGPTLYGQEDAAGWDQFACNMVKAGLATRVSYNPYKGPTFYNVNTGLPVNVADAVVMVAEKGSPPRVYAIRPRWEE